MKREKRTRVEILSDPKYQGKWIVIIEKKDRARVASVYDESEPAYKETGRLREMGKNACAIFVGPIFEPGTDYISPQEEYSPVGIEEDFPEVSLVEQAEHDTSMAVRKNVIGIQGNSSLALMGPRYVNASDEHGLGVQPPLRRVMREII